jgi:hypothetical protein
LEADKLAMGANEGKPAVRASITSLVPISHFATEVKAEYELTQMCTRLKPRKIGYVSMVASYRSEKARNSKTSSIMIM